MAKLLFETMTSEDWAKVHTAKRWEKMEAWLFDNYEDRQGTFTSKDLAASADIARTEASRWVRAYLDAQRRSKSTTLYVLKREGRTTSAVWSVGQRTLDGKIMGETAFEDIVVRIKGALIPDWQRLAKRNPRASRWTDAKISAVLDGALTVLAASLEAEYEYNQNQN